MGRAAEVIRKRTSHAIISAATIVLSMVVTAGAADKVGRYLKKPDAWYAGEEAAKKAANVLSHQSESGGWARNADTVTAPFSGKRKEIQGTFDNGATTDELRFLARMYSATRDERYRKAFTKGFDHILKAQYPNGGWPQYYPPPKDSYNRYITFNDDAMVRLMLFLRETYEEPRYGFLDKSRRDAARTAFDRGIQCILRCQVKVNGKLTVWCAQHDEKDFSPRPARNFEPVSLSGSESARIVHLLMSLPNPSPEVIRSVDAAVKWFETVQLRGVRVVVRKDEKSPTGKDRFLVKEPGAKPMWARFYEIGTNRPIYCDRDKVKKYNLSEIGHERRNGYAWLGYWGESLLGKEYPTWKQRLSSPATSPRPATNPAASSSARSFGGHEHDA